MRARYREHLQAAVASSAAPYGYTLTVWTSGAVTSHARGIPTAAEAFLFMVGAVLGFAVVGWSANGGIGGILSTTRRFDIQLWGGVHLFSVGSAIGAASIVNALIDHRVAWPIVGFISTAVYLVVVAAQFTLTQVIQDD